MLLSKICDRKLEENFSDKESELYKTIKNIHPLRYEHTWKPRKVFENIKNEIYGRVEMIEMKQKL